jgi:hypothetical protein
LGRVSFADTELGKKAVKDIFRCTNSKDGLEGLKGKSEIGSDKLWGGLI